jgi:hypothetical protein
MRHLLITVSLGFVVACSAPAPGPSGGEGTAVPGVPGSSAPSGAGDGTSATSDPSSGTGATGEDAGGGVVGSSGEKDAGSSASSGNGKDAGGGTNPSGGGSAKTWSEIYASYLASGKVGHCGDCHGAASDATGAYGFLQGAGYINGTQSTVSSIFGFMGGAMPPPGGGTPDPTAVAEVDSWVAAGAKDD